MDQPGTSVAGMEPVGPAPVVTIHQPEHLPWLGFFAKMARADVLIALDTVPWRNNYVQNRNRVLGPDGGLTWLTVPVSSRDHLQGAIADVTVADAGRAARWRENYLRTLEQRYRAHPFFQPLFGEIEDVLLLPWDRLADLNLALIAVLARHLDVRTSVVRASTLRCKGARTDLLASLCARAGAATYLAGPSARDYVDPAPFESAGIALRIHDYDHPVYTQRGAAAFASPLSAVDLLFNLGDEAARVLRSGSRVSPFAAATTPAVA